MQAGGKKKVFAGGDTVHLTFVNFEELLDLLGEYQSTNIRFVKIKITPFPFLVLVPHCLCCTILFWPFMFYIMMMTPFAVSLSSFLILHISYLSPSPLFYAPSFTTLSSLPSPTFPSPISLSLSSPLLPLSHPLYPSILSSI